MDRILLRMLHFELLCILWSLVSLISRSSEVEYQHLDSGSAFPSLRVMQFNVWQSGGNVADGIDKIAKHIRIINADVVALQEIGSNELDQVLEELGGTYVGVKGNKTYPDVAIITKHTIFENTFAYTDDKQGVGVQIEMPTGHKINFWSLHIDYTSYGPYAANNKMATNRTQIMIGENGRVGNINNLLNNEHFKEQIQDENTSLIVCGDLNSPSHIDWIESTKHLHGGWVVEWPVTKFLENVGLTDSFREAHPDPLTHPGITWSTVHIQSGPQWGWSIPEPQDRIDFIYRKGNMLRTLDSFTYSGVQQLNTIPNQRKNDYPSDHYAVISDFILTN